MKIQEDKSKPNPDWVSAPYEAHGIELRDGKWVKITWKMKDRTLIEIVEPLNEDHSKEYSKEDHP